MSAPNNSSTSTQNERAEALLRTVTGIVDARIVSHAAGSVAIVRVVTNDAASRGQVIRNVRSALYAGFGIAISNECVDFTDSFSCDVGTAAPTVSAIETSAVTVAEPPAQSVPAVQNFPNNYSSTPVPVFQVRGDTNAPRVATAASVLRVPRIMQVVAEEKQAAPAAVVTSAPVASPAGVVVRDIVASAAALKLESVEVRRQSGRMRCRVVISLGAEHFGAVADSSDPTASEIHLAGRVACDALRAGGFTDARFDGATTAQINGRQHVVVALSEWMSGETVVLSGAAPLEDLPERAAAIAAIKAVLAQDIN